MIYFIRTNSLDTDDRYQKTRRFLSALGTDCCTYAVVHNISGGGRECKQVQLLSRRYFSSGRSLPLKYLELVIRSFGFFVFSPGRCWFANFDFMALHTCIALVSFGGIRPIWDLHEMPPSWVAQNRMARVLFRFLLQRSDVIVCNAARLRALERSFEVDLSHALVLRNYPSQKSILDLAHYRQEYLSRSDRIENGYQIIVTGGVVPGRYVEESVSVVEYLRRRTGANLQVKIVGGTPLESAPSFVNCTGAVPFDELVRYCVEGSISLCFYAMTNENNILCEPNRYYQALICGQYLLTFDHPSLKDIKYPRQVIVDHEHFADSLAEKLWEVVCDVLTNNDEKRDLIAGYEDRFSFEAQFSKFNTWMN